MTTEREALEAIRNYAIALQKGAMPDDAEEVRILAMIDDALAAPERRYTLAEVLACVPTSEWATGGSKEMQAFRDGIEWCRSQTITNLEAL